jgi:uncharacterized protein with von Willebrand factor type A (vWA) domain
MPFRFTAFNRYSRWDGSQMPELNADDIMAALSDDLMEFGDLEQAMRYLMQRGMEGEEGSYIKGLRDMLKELKDQRNQRLEHYDLSSVLEDIKRQLDEILEMEQTTIDEWQSQNSSDDESDRFMEKLLNDQGDSDSSGHNTNDPGTNSPETNDLDANSDAGQSGSEQDFSSKLLNNIGKQNQQFLDELPKDPAGKVRALENYEFLNTDAQKKFLKLVDDLRKSMTQSYFKDVQDMVNNMSAGDIERMKQMVKDLNEMLVKKIAGEDPGFDSG